MWELNHKKGWVLKNWCFWIVVLEKTVERQLDCKVIKLVTPKGNQPWIFIERTDAEAEAPVLLNTLATWCKEQTHWKRPWAWGRWRAGEEAGNRGWDGWMASLTQWTWVCSLLGDGEGQGSLACCSPWGHKESDKTTTTDIYVDKNLPLIECLLCTKTLLLFFYLCNHLVFHMLFSFTVQHKMKIRTRFGFLAICEGRMIEGQREDSSQCLHYS